MVLDIDQPASIISRSL